MKINHPRYIPEGLGIYFSNLPIPFKEAGDTGQKPVEEFKALDNQ